MRISLRGLTIILTVSIAAGVGAVTLLLSVSAWATSIDDTRDAGDAGIDALEASGMDNVQQVVDQMMFQSVSEISAKVSKYMATASTVIEVLVNQLNTFPIELLRDPVWRREIMVPIVWHAYRWNADRGIRVLALMVTRPPGPYLPIMVVQVQEQPDTTNKYSIDYEEGDPENFHAYTVTLIDSEGAVGYSPDDETGQPKTAGRNATDWPCDNNRPIRSKGKEPKGICPMGGSAGGLMSDPSSLAMMRAIAAGPAMKLQFSKFFEGVAGAGVIGVAAFGAMRGKPGEMPSLFGPHSGVAFAVQSTEALSRFFQGLSVPDGSRVYAIFQDPPPTVTRTQLLGASHGDVYTEGGYIMNDEERAASGNDLKAKYSVNILNSTDRITREHGTATLAMANDWEAYEGSQRHEWIDSQGKLFWVKVQRFANKHGLIFFITLLVPRDSAMAIIDASNIEVRRRIEKQNAEVSDDVDTQLTTIIVVVVVIVLAVIGISVGIAVLITAPLKMVEQQMTSAARMDLDSVDTTQPLSRLSEVRSIQKSFARLLRSLKEYRNYMPQSLLVTDDGDEDVEEEPLEASKAAGSQAQSRSRKTASRHSTVNRTQHSSMQSSKSAAMRQFLQKHTAEGVKKKKCSFLITGVRGFHERWGQGKSDDVALHLHSEMISKVVASVTKDKGCADTFSGDRVLTSFGAVKPLGGHAAAACRAALAVKGACGDADGGTEASRSRARMDMTCSVAGGEARVGNMGCAGMKKFSCVSGVVTWAYALERYASSCVTGGTAICTDGFAVEDTAGSFMVRLVDSIAFPKRSQKVVKVWELMSAMAVGEDEWMYQLEEAGDKDPNKLWNKVVMAVQAEGGVAEAREGLAQLKQPGNMVDAPTSSGLLQRLEEMVTAAESGASYKPQQMSFH